MIIIFPARLGRIISIGFALSDIRAYHELSEIRDSCVKPHFLTSLILLVCMVFSTSATAFLHLNEHQLDMSHADLTHSERSDDTDQHHDHDVSAEHAHHFNLHVTCDLVAHDPIFFAQVAHPADTDFVSTLISRSYTPPTPPPNA